MGRKDKPSLCWGCPHCPAMLKNKDCFIGHLAFECFEVTPAPLAEDLYDKTDDELLAATGASRGFRIPNRMGLEFTISTMRNRYVALVVGINLC